MLRRIRQSFIGLMAFALATGVSAQVNATKDGATFQAKVGIIVKWLNPKVDVTGPDSELRDWNNSLNTDASATDSIAILRLVTNVDVRLTGTAQPLFHPELPNETLATFVCVQTDGNGLEESLVDGTGDPATGFPHQEYRASAGIGPEFTSPNRNFVYIGGGSATAEVGAWVSPERLADLSSVPGQQAQFAIGNLLGEGTLVKHVPRDGAVLIRITMRGLNGEDFGIDSDDTEAPDLAVQTPYTATVQLTALP